MVHIKAFLLITYAFRIQTALIQNFTIVIVGLRGTTNPTDARIVGPGLELAVRDMRKRYPSLSFQVEIWKYPFLNSCDNLEFNIADAAARMYYDKLESPYPISAFIGTGCAYADRQLLNLLIGWNLGFFDGSSLGAFFADRERYPITVGFSYNQMRAGEFFYEVAWHFTWKRVTALYDFNDAIWRGMFTSMDYFRTHREVTLEPINLVPSDVAQSVIAAHTTSRVCFILATPSTVRTVMIAAHRLGYTKGDHVYMAVAYFQTKYYFGMPQWRMNMSDDEETKEAFQSLFLVREYTAASDRYLAFSKTVQKMSFSQYNESIEPDDEVNVHATAFYDAVLTYAQVVHEAHIAGQDIFDGRKMLNRLVNRTFEGIRGNFTLNKDTAVAGHFELWNFRSQSGDFVKVMDFPDDAVNVTVVRAIEWASGGSDPPPGSSFCWFNNDNPACQINKIDVSVLYWALVIVALAIVGASFVFAIEKIAQHRNSKISLYGWKLPHQYLFYHLSDSSAGAHLRFMRKYEHYRIQSSLSDKFRKVF